MLLNIKDNLRRDGNDIVVGIIITLREVKEKKNYPVIYVNTVLDVVCGQNRKTSESVKRAFEERPNMPVVDKTPIHIFFRIQAKPEYGL